MTHKDYTALACVLLEVRNTGSGPQWANICNQHARAIADVLARDNPRFNLSRFLEAAGTSL